MTVDPHTAERIIVIGDAAVGGKLHAMQLRLSPDTRGRWPEVVTAFLNDTVKYDSTTTAVFVQPEYRELPETHAIAALVSEHYKQARINQNTVEAIGENQGRNFVRNLRRISAGPGLETLGAREWLPSMRGWTAVVCGAGVSFERDRELVRKHQGPVIAVNTSAGACAQGDVFPHVVVCTESKDVGEGIARMNHARSHFAMDLMGFPGNWPTDVAADVKRPLCFMGTEPNLAPYGQQLGLLPLAYGSSCTTAAVSLALACGAERVVLVGQDCGFELCDGEEGEEIMAARMYASGTPYEETRVLIKPSVMRANVMKPHAGDGHVDVLTVPGVDGRPVWTTHSMLSFAQWFSSQPDDVSRRIVNATSSGVMIEGLAHAPLQDVLTYTGDRYSTSVARRRAFGLGGEQVDELPRRAGRLTKHLRNMAKHGLTLELDCQVLDWARAHSILNMWTAPERLRMRRLDGLSTADKGHRVAAAVRRACAEIVACANGEAIGT